MILSSFGKSSINYSLSSHWSTASLHGSKTIDKLIDNDCFFSNHVKIPALFLDGVFILNILDIDTERNRYDMILEETRAKSQ